ncbi:hypothetical protein KC675_05080 [Candidatus Dojkabacteria bacterium]|uniref:Uncharacterized protein n=1 Tax=Candidatus Dojkabacteria bacterium TaxID=2099670 RepID=A0A955L0S7_9BACT|nr:hypothetical protein [Candidatus Dojkabacteria bacterium]
MDPTQQAWAWVPGKEFGYDDNTGEGGIFDVPVRRNPPNAPNGTLHYVKHDYLTREELHTDTVGQIWRKLADRVIGNSNI